MRIPILTLLLAASSVASAKVVETLTYSYYNADLSSGQSMVKALNAASPHKEAGKIFYGSTNWNVHASFQLSKKPDGSCGLGRVQIDLGGNIDLPRLSGANPSQEAEFERFLAALRTHELGHYALAREIAAEVDATLAELHKPTCRELKSAVDTIQSETRRTFDARSARYDAQTNHGQTQGASLKDH